MAQKRASLAFNPLSLKGGNFSSRPSSHYREIAIAYARRRPPEVVGAQPVRPGKHEECRRGAVTQWQIHGGDTWTHLETGLYDPDIHAVTIAATQPKRLYASTAREVFTSSDLGDTWQALGIKQKWPLPYARGMAVKADDPGVLFAGCGETTTGEKGHVLRTTNFGETWEILPLPTQPNATVWGLATHPTDADRIVAFSLFGEVYVSEDAGACWRKIAREFGEIRAAAWVPN